MPRLHRIARLTGVLLPGLLLAVPLPASAAADSYTCPGANADQVTGVSDGSPTSTVTGDTDKISLVVANSPEQQDFKAQYGHIGNHVVDSAHVQMTNDTTADFGPGDAIVDLPAPIERIDVCGHAVAPVTSVSLQTNAATITAGNRPTLYGAITVSGGGADVAGRTVTLYGKAWGSAGYQLLDSALSESDGVYRFTVAPATQTAYVAKVDAAQSPTLLIRVHQRININQPIANSSHAVGQFITFSGTTFPASPGLPIGLASISNGIYTYRGETTANAQGAWSMTIKLPAVNVFVVYCSAHGGLRYGSKSIRIN